MPFDAKYAKAAARVLKEQAEKKDATSLLSLDDNYVFCQVALTHVPMKSERDWYGPRQYPLPVPHCLFEGAEVCVFIADKGDQEGAKRALRTAFAADGIANLVRLAKIIPVNKLTGKYYSYEAKRKLCGSYDLFLADTRILPILANRIGKTFFATKKHPMSFVLADHDVARITERIRYLINCAPVSFNHAASHAFRIARLGFSADQIAENCQAALDGFAKLHLVNGWRHIQTVTMHADGITGVALPIYRRLPKLVVDTQPADADKPKKKFDNFEHFEDSDFSDDSDDFDDSDEDDKTKEQKEPAADAEDTPKRAAPPAVEDKPKKSWPDTPMPKKQTSSKKSSDTPAAESKRTSSKKSSDTPAAESKKTAADDGKKASATPSKKTVADDKKTSATPSKKTVADDKASATPSKKTAADDGKKTSATPSKKTEKTSATPSKKTAADDKASATPSKKTAADDKKASTTPSKKTAADDKKTSTKKTRVSPDTPRPPPSSPTRSKRSKPEKDVPSSSAKVQKTSRVEAASSIPVKTPTKRLATPRK